MRQYSLGGFRGLGADPGDATQRNTTFPFRRAWRMLSHAIRVEDSDVEHHNFRIKTAQEITNIY